MQWFPLICDCVLEIEPNANNCHDVKKVVRQCAEHKGMLPQQLFQELTYNWRCLSNERLPELKLAEKFPEWGIKDGH